MYCMYTYSVDQVPVLNVCTSLPNCEEQPSSITPSSSYPATTIRNGRICFSKNHILEFIIHIPNKVFVPIIPYNQVSSTKFCKEKTNIQLHFQNIRNYLQRTTNNIKQEKQQTFQQLQLIILISLTSTCQERGFRMEKFCSF